MESTFCFNFLPEEILLHIFSYVEPNYLLTCSLVCKIWNILIKSNTLWYKMYERKYQEKAKKLPWRVYYCLMTKRYFDRNLLHSQNDASSDVTNSDTPSPLNDGLLLKIRSRYYGRIQYKCYGSGRVVTTDYNTVWFINLGKNKLFHQILKQYKPHICITGCGDISELNYGTLDANISSKKIPRGTFTPDLQSLVITHYPDVVQGILLEPDVRQCRSVKILFKSIEPLPKESQDGDGDFKQESVIKFTFESSQ